MPCSRSGFRATVPRFGRVCGVVPGVTRTPRTMRMMTTMMMRTPWVRGGVDGTPSARPGAGVSCSAGFGAKPKQGMRGDPNARGNKTRGRPSVADETGASPKDISASRAILDRLGDALGGEERVKQVRQILQDGIKAERDAIDALGLVFFQVTAFYRNEAMDGKKLRDYNVLGFVLEFAKAELGDKAKDWYSEGEVAPEFQLPEGMGMQPAPET